jgi:hypothetical protein
LSSILRALKKIQTDTAASSGIQAGPGMTGSARSQEVSYIYKGILAAAIVMGLAIGSVWIIKSMTKSQSEVSKPVYETPEINQFPQTDLALQKTTGENTAQIQAQPLPNKEIPVAKPPAAELTDQLPAHGDHLESPEDMNSLSEDHGVDHIQNPDTLTSTRIISPDKKNEDRRILSNYDEIDESSGLDLQAISWAADAQKRLVIINGTLCRENESVSGYVIKQINPDDVIVSNGTITGKLVLKIR